MKLLSLSPCLPSFLLPARLIHTRVAFMAIGVPYAPTHVNLYAVYKVLKHTIPQGQPSSANTSDLHVPVVWDIAYHHRLVFLCKDSGDRDYFVAYKDMWLSFLNVASCEGAQTQPCFRGTATLNCGEFLSSLPLCLRARNCSSVRHRYCKIMFAMPFLDP